jgi:hypothetical protein
MLFWGVINCLALYGLIRLFERNRSEIDGFDIALAAIAPVIVLLLARGVMVLFHLGAWANYAALIVFTGAIVLILWKMAKIPLKRSFVYALVILVLNVTLSLVLTGNA